MKTFFVEKKKKKLDKVTNCQIFLNGGFQKSYVKIDNKNRNINNILNKK